MMSDKRLKSVLSKAKSGSGWGPTGVLEIDGHKVFFKRIPLTDLELANAYSTRNLYRIPTWYNYGIGSAGFGAFRELAAHIKTTNWVREGKLASVPLLHHHRILTSEQGVPAISNLKGYISYWNGSKSIERYMVERGKSKQHLLLFLEYLTPVSEWMTENPSRLPGMFKKAIKTIDILHQNDLLHFDAHIYNWLTDGKNVFLTDFGLALDREFELTQSEQQFFNKHRYYDYAQVVEGFAYALMQNHFSLNASQDELVDKEMEKSLGSNEPSLNSWIQAALKLHEAKKIHLPPLLTGFIRRYQPVIFAKNQFFLELG